MGETYKMGTTAIPVDFPFLYKRTSKPFIIFFLKNQSFQPIKLRYIKRGIATCEYGNL